MTQILLPLLIREKIKDYLSFTEWRDKITQVCIEYHKKFELYEGDEGDFCTQKDYLKCYNYRCLNNINFRKMWDYGRVMSNRLADLGPVSQNY
jgi:hypothetical protein